MKSTRILTLMLALCALGLTGCAGKVSGRFNMQQRFAAGVSVQETSSF